MSVILEKMMTKVELSIIFALILKVIPITRLKKVKKQKTLNVFDPRSFSNKFKIKKG